jgi:hemin uptake protein HemP
MRGATPFHLMRRWFTRPLCSGATGQVVIGHNGCRYVLRITRHGKLILNK